MAFDAQKFGVTIKTLRGSAGMTQSVLAAKAGMTQAAIVMIEQGKRGVSIESIEHLASALDVPAECLSILAFRSVSKSKEIDAVSDSLKRLVQTLFDAREEMKAVAKPKLRIAKGRVAKPSAIATPQKVARKVQALNAGR